MSNVEKGNVKRWTDLANEAASKGQGYSAMYRKLAKMLGVPSRRMAGVTTFKLDRHTKANDNVIVPRKVLMKGAIDHKISIAALEYSKPAAEALKKAGCEIVDIKEMLGRKRINIIV